ncbi:DNA mismatch repair protein MutS, partial [Baffinella frigidus]
MNHVVFPKNGLDAGVVKMIRRHLDKPIINAIDPVEQLMRHLDTAIIKALMIDPVEQYWDSETTLRELQFAGYFSDKSAGAEKGKDGEKAGDKEGGDGAWPELLATMRDENQKLALSALGGCVWYLRSLKLDTELVSMRNFRSLGDFDGACAETLVIDGQTLANLEILENGDGGAQGSVLKMLDRCVTAFGKRKLRSWLCAPLVNPADINARLDAIELLAASPSRTSITALLRKLPDVERNLSRVHIEASARKQGVMFDNSSAKKLRAFLLILDACQVLCDVQDKLAKGGLFKSGEEEAAGGDVAMEDAGAGGGLRKLVRFPKGARETLTEFKKNYGDLHKAMEDGFISPQSGVHQDYDEAFGVQKGIERKLDKEMEKWGKELKCGSLKYWHPAVGKEPYQME